jgi:peptidyl-Lys metalloendopeptidase
MSRRIRIISISAALILTGMITSAAVWAARLPDIGSQLTMQPTPITDSRSVNVTVTVTNRSTEPQTFLRRGTAFADLFDSPIFAVERNGEPLQYLGRMVKYGPPTPADFITLGPGESRAVTVNIGDVYDLSFPGLYRVQIHAGMRGVSGRVPDFDGGARGSWTGQLGSNVVDFSIEADAVRAYVPIDQRDGLSRGPGINTGADTFTGCTAAEQTAVQAAIDKACLEAIAAAAAAQQVVTNAAGDANWIEWFGAFNAARATTVRDNWNAIRDAICPTASSKKNEYVCHGGACSPGVFAYTLPITNPNTIYLCDGFWNAGNVPGRFDSRSGTLIHEMSHLKAGTSDFAYGTTNCRDLATNNPANAIANADNYEYYAEDLNAKAKTPGMTPVGTAALCALLATAGAAVIVRRRSLAA